MSSGYVAPIISYLGQITWFENLRENFSRDILSMRHLTFFKVYGAQNICSGTVRLGTFHHPIEEGEGRNPPFFYVCQRLAGVGRNVALLIVNQFI